MSVKKRVLTTKAGNSRSWFTVAGGPPTNIVITPIYQTTTQQTTSTGTAFKSRKRRRKRKRAKFADHGSAFHTTKMISFYNREVYSYGSSGSVTYFYEGPYRVGPGAFPPLLPSPSQNNLNAWGTTAISRVLPTNPLAGMGQFLGELRQLPKLPALELAKARLFKLKNEYKKLSRLSKASASEYLNFQFGWFPFVKDLLKLSEVIAEKDKHIAQYERDSGRLVRRRITILDTSNTSVTNQGSSYGRTVLPSPHYTGPGQLIQEITTSEKIWFSGAFTYHLETGRRPTRVKRSKNRRSRAVIPPGSDPSLVAKRNRQIKRKLYGLSLDPYTLYQLFPWSWAVDWFTNLGSVVKNLVAFHNDGLVMKYGYVMHYKRVTTKYSLNGLGLLPYGNIDLQTVYVQTTKTRAKATPFGFGLNPNAFSARQWSIVAALGISRAPRSLNF